MFTNPGLLSQLARDHQRQMLAEAHHRQPRRRHHLATAKIPGTTAITHRLAAMFTRAGVVAAPAPGAFWDRGGADAR